MNYEKDIKIDETALDIEWLEQPAKMMRYTKNAAQTEHYMNQAKEELEFTYAEIDKEVRANPEKYGLEKTTETVIRNAVITTKAYQNVKDEYLKSKYEFDISKGAVQAFQHRKNALENLVTLHGQQYFAGPSSPKNISREWEGEMKQKRANKKVRMRRKQ